MNKANAIALALGVLHIPAVSMAAQQSVAGADSPASKMLIYISPQEYSHPVLLRHPYYRYWFEQGPRVEALAKKEFGAKFDDVTMCEGNANANAVVWLKPSMFYNPVARTYYGKIVAEVFAGDGKPLGTFTANARRVGSIDINTANLVNATYDSAINDIVSQLAADQGLQSVLSKDGVVASIPCATVSLYSRDKPFSFY